MTDKVLLANGELIERTYFLKDLKAGDKLYGVQDLKGSHYSGSVLDRFKIVEVTIQKLDENMQILQYLILEIPRKCF